MTRPLTTTVGGRSNRRFMLLAIFAAVVSAALVYAAVNRATEETTSGGGVSTVPAVVAKVDIPARAEVTPSMVELRQIAVDARSDLAYTDLADVVGKVTRFPIATNEQVLSTKLVALAGIAQTQDSLSFVIPKGMRAIAITVSEVVSGGGLVLPGDYVDIIGVFDLDSDDPNREGAESFFAQTVLQNVEVLAVAQQVVDAPPAAVESDGTQSGQRERVSEADANPKAATVTLAVNPDDAQMLFLAEANGVLRLTVRPYGEDEMPTVPYIDRTELMPAGLAGPGPAQP